MNLQKALYILYQEVIDALCKIEEFPEGLLPHMVYVEEEGKDTLKQGCSVFNLYNLIRIHKDGSCILEDPETGKEEERQLKEINIEWLIVVWDYYKDLSAIKPEPIQKELFAFLYPTESFERNVTDDEILSGWADDYVEKMTPDEFAAMVNDGGFSDAEQWVRFIEVEA
jgi:hypothetical protein